MVKTSLVQSLFEDNDCNETEEEENLVDKRPERISFATSTTSTNQTSNVYIEETSSEEEDD